MNWKRSINMKILKILFFISIYFVLTSKICMSQNIKKATKFLEKGDIEKFEETINEILDNPTIRDKWSDKSLKRFDNGKLENAIKPFNKMINETIDNLPTLKSDTDTYKKVVDFIHKKGSVSKADILNFLNWGVRISFSGYRNRLRKESTIKFTKDRYEVKWKN